jgi:hypothetical protein
MACRGNSIAPQPERPWCRNLVHYNPESKGHPAVPVSAAEMHLTVPYHAFSAAQAVATWLILYILKKMQVGPCFTHKSTWFDHLAAWCMVSDAWPCPWLSSNLRYILVVMCLQVGVISDTVGVLHMV